MAKTSKTKLIAIVMPVSGKYKNKTFTEIFNTQTELEEWLSKLGKQLGKDARITGYVVAGKIVKVWM